MKSASLNVCIAFAGLFTLAGSTPAATIGAPGVVTLSTPADNAALVDPQPYFSWSQTDPVSDWFHLRFLDGTNYFDEWVEGTNYYPTFAFAPGDHSWWVQGWNYDAGFGPWSQPFHFTLPTEVPGQVTPVSPSQTVLSNSMVHFSWTTVSNASWYRLIVLKSNSWFWDRWYRLADASAPVTNGTFEKFVGGFYGGNYRWWVQAWNSAGNGLWSPSASFSVADLTPGIVRLLSPSGAQPNSARGTFTWTAEPNAAYYECLVLRNGSTFMDEWFDAALDGLGPATNNPYLWISGGPSATNFSVTILGRAGGTYQWWVRAWNPQGMGPWSVPLTFTVPVQAPAATALIAPYGTLRFGEAATFSWTPVTNAPWYHVLIQQKQWNGSYFNTIDYWTTETSYTTSLLPIGSYKWAVQTWNEDGYGPWSATYNCAVSGN